MRFILVAKNSFHGIVEFTKRRGDQYGFAYRVLFIKKFIGKRFSISPHYSADPTQ